MKDNTPIEKQSQLPINWKRYLFGSIGITVIISIYWLFDFYPYHPKTFSGWLIFVILGIPLYLVLELISEKIFAFKRFSQLSIINLLIVVVVLLVITVIGVVVNGELLQN